MGRSSPAPTGGVTKSLVQVPGDKPCGGAGEGSRSGGLRERGGVAGSFCSGEKGEDLGSILRKTVVIPFRPCGSQNSCCLPLAKKNQQKTKHPKTSEPHYCKLSHFRKISIISLEYITHKHTHTNTT